MFSDHDNELSGSAGGEVVADMMTDVGEIGCRIAHQFPDWIEAREHNYGEFD